MYQRFRVLEVMEILMIGTWWFGRHSWKSLRKILQDAVI